MPRVAFTRRRQAMGRVSRRPDAEEHNAVSGTGIGLHSVNLETWERGIDTRAAGILKAASKVSDTRQRHDRARARRLILRLINAKNEVATLSICERDHLGQDFVARVFADLARSGYPAVVAALFIRQTPFEFDGVALGSYGRDQFRHVVDGYSCDRLRKDGEHPASPPR